MFEPSRPTESVTGRYVLAEDWNGRKCVGVVVLDSRYPNEVRVHYGYEERSFRGPDAARLEDLQPCELMHLNLNGETVATEEGERTTFRWLYIEDREPVNLWCGGKVVALVWLCNKWDGRTRCAYISRGDNGKLHLAVPA